MSLLLDIIGKFPQQLNEKEKRSFVQMLKKNGFRKVDYSSGRGCSFSTFANKTDRVRIISSLKDSFYSIEITWLDGKNVQDEKIRELAALMGKRI